MKNALCFFSIPRTGTSHLMEILTNIPCLSVYKEVFHPDAVFGLQDHPIILSSLANHLGIENNSIFNEYLIKWIHSEPHKFISFLQNAALPDGKKIAFKIFPGHLSYSQLDEFIINNDEFAHVIIQRRPIDVYISDLKAIKAKSHEKIDTTNIKLDINVDAYEEWWLRTMSWYSFLQNNLVNSNKRYVKLYYESDISGDPEIILRKLCKSLSNDLQMTVGPMSHTGLFKQDLTSSYAEKVSNWREFMDLAIDRQLDNKLYDYFI